MTNILEPKFHSGKCPYCGDAPVNHRLTYLENFISSIITSHIFGSTKHTPQFIKSFANFVPVLLFKTLAFFGVAHFSKDIDKANSFRSRIIWEEAKRRGIEVEQIILGKRPIDWYRAEVNGKMEYYESIPIQPEFLDFEKNWDNKIILKKELAKNGVPVPFYKKLSPASFRSLENVFKEFKTPVIVKPASGSRGRHTITNIKNINDFKNAVKIAKQISAHLVVEEYLEGHVYRATLVGGRLAGFYMGQSPFVVGDGVHTIHELIKEKDEKRNKRIEVININEELHAHIARSGFKLNDVLEKGVTLKLTHRTGRLFGGETKEMIDELHPSFVPFLEKAAKVVGLSVIGFDCIIPDPTKDESTERWGIIECNTLPFIDLHYYALEGKPRNIAGMIWDLWD